MPDIPAGTKVMDLSTIAGRLSAAWNVLRGQSPATAVSNVPTAQDNLTSRPFGPGQPLEPLVRGDGKPEILPRQFIYPSYVNTIVSPRREYAVLTSFEQLRNLASLYDVAAMCIGARVEEMQGLGWAIAAKNKKHQTALQDVCDEVDAFWKSPDKLNDFGSWMGMLLYELFSIDAMTIYKRPTRGGGLYGLEVVDGSTIKPLIDDRGRTLAYQQIVWGYPESGYKRPSADAPDEQLPVFAPTELIYRPRWVRSFTPYGYPPTEWIILRVNMALRKQTFDMSYFTEGNVPEGFASVPQELVTPEQVKAFEESFNAVLAGNDSTRRRMRFMPWKTDIAWAKPFSYDTQLDRWMLGITCAAFGVLPSELGFTDDVNKATADHQENINERRGLRPLCKWLKDAFFDPLIPQLSTMPDGVSISLRGQPTRAVTDPLKMVEWRWQFAESEDALRAAQTHGLDITNGVISADESRAMRYADELDGPAPQTAVAAPMTMTAKIAKAKKTERDEWEQVAQKKMRDAYNAQMERAMGVIDESRVEEVEANLVELFSTEPNKVRWALQSFFDDMATQAASEAIERIGGAGADWTLINDAVLRLAQERAAVFGQEISETSQRQLLEIIADWISTGGTMGDLKERAARVWTGPRPDVAAVTETTRIFSDGQRVAWEASGVVSGYNVVTANDDRVRETHIEAAKNGPYPISDTEHLPPINGDPNCRCDISPVVTAAKDIR